MDDNLEEGEIVDALDQVEEAEPEVVIMETMEAASETAEVDKPADIDFAASPTIFSYLPPWNWFNSTGFDILCQPPNDTLLAYGARSFLSLVTIDNNDNTIRYHDMINVFNLRSNDHADSYRAVPNSISTVVFEKPKHKGSPSARVFVGTNEGLVGVFDVHQRKTIVQKIPFEQYKRSCCKMTNQHKVSSAAWLHFHFGSVVFYVHNINIVRWDVDADQVQVLHSPQCSQSKVAVACLASSQANHNLAAGYMGGKVILYSFHPSYGEVMNMTTLTDNGHLDDICSLAFSYQANSLYRQGLLASVSRNGILKIWCSATYTEIIEYRIKTAKEDNNNNKGRENKSGGNWFATIFLPKVSANIKNVAYEVLISSGQGQLFRVTVPEKVLSSKLRLIEANKFSKGNVQHSSVIFSMSTDIQHNRLVTMSLDSKLIVWCLEKHTPLEVCHTFRKGVFGLSSNQIDKRLAIAFGSSVSVLDFAETSDTTSSSDTFKVAAKDYFINLGHASHGDTKQLMLTSVLWNRPEMKSKAGQLVLSNNVGDVFVYDLANRRLSRNAANGHKGNDKVYSLVWAPNIPLGPGEDNIGNAVFSLHKNGKIMLNFVKIPSEHNTAANFKVRTPATEMFEGLPDNCTRKACSLAISDDEQHLVMGNDDGSVDVFGRSSGHKLYRHCFRFRFFVKPVVAMEMCQRTKRLAMVSLVDRGKSAKGHDAIVCCSLEDCFKEMSNDDGQPLKVISPPKIQLTGGHVDRIISLAFSPFNDAGGECLLVSGSYDATCIIWNVLEERPLKVFFGHRSLIHSLKWCHFHPCFIFSAGEDNFHIWDWTKQEDFDDQTTMKSLAERNKITVVNVKRNMITGMDEEHDDEMTVVVEKDKSMASRKKIVDKVETTATGQHVIGAKSLFPLDNQVENSSTRFDTLEDIKWIHKLSLATKKTLQEDNAKLAIPEAKLNRILIYGTREHVLRFLKNEAEHHRRMGNTEAEEMLSLFTDPRQVVVRGVEEGNVDLFLVTIASGLGDRELWKKAIEVYTDDVSIGSNSIAKPKRPNVFAIERAAMMQMFVLHNFGKAIETLTSQGLYRQAIILAQMNLASADYIENVLYHRWAQHRSEKDPEGAIKSLLAAHRYEEAVALLQQQRSLAKGMAAAKMLKLFDELIEMIKEETTTLSQEDDGVDDEIPFKKLKLDN